MKGMVLIDVFRNYCNNPPIFFFKPAKIVCTVRLVQLGGENHPILQKSSQIEREKLPYLATLPARPRALTSA